MELTKFVDENDPLLGDTVTLICRFYYRTSNAERPSWAYHIGTNKAMQPINETDPPDGDNS